MKVCHLCTKRIWPWQKESSSPVDGTNRKVYFHNRICPRTIGERFCLQLWWIIPLSIILCVVGGLVAAHFLWFLPKG